MAFGFVGSASVLGIFNFAFLLYFFSFFFFYLLPIILKETRLSACPSHLAYF